MVKLSKTLFYTLFGCLLFLSACSTKTTSVDEGTQVASDSTSNSSQTMAASSIYDFTMYAIDGKEISFSTYKGKKLLLVNVASECGYTPQYKDLQSLHEQYGDTLVILGFPANNFGGQEPGTNEEIAAFCSSKFNVTFQMFSKISVKGDDQHPLYQWLASKEKNGVLSETPNWNFCKFLIDEQGKPVKFFGSSVNPAEILIEIKEGEL